MASASKLRLKEDLLAQIAQKLGGELEAARKAARAAYEAATNAESKAENKYDTRGLEASYLAGAQKERENVLEAGLALVQRLRVEAAAAAAAAAAADGDDGPIKLLSLVEVDQAGETTCYFLAPVGAGYELTQAGEKIHVVTPQSPLGQQLLGKRSGEVVTLRSAQGRKELEVLCVW